jgi:subtilisin family serine protease
MLSSLLVKIQAAWDLPLAGERKTMFSGCERYDHFKLSRFRLFLLCLLCLLINPQVLHADSVQQHIPDALPESLLSRLQVGIPQEVLVAFDSLAVEEDAESIRADRALPHHDFNIREFKSDRFRQIKDRVFESIPESEVGILIDYSHLPMALVHLRSYSALTRLLRFSEVIAVYENSVVYMHLAQSLPLVNQPAAASEGFTGFGSNVAVLDTGVNYIRPEFGSCSEPGFPETCRVVASVEIAPDDGSLDDNGHGTNVAAIAAGVAPESGIAALDVFNSDGTSTSALVIDGINWAIANKDAYSIVAINMSLGDGSRRREPCSNRITNPYVLPIEQALSAGIIPVASSGNNGFIDGISSPACTPGVVSVGAVYDANIGSVCFGTNCSICTDSVTGADQVACFSNSASFLTMLAPGANVTAGGYTYRGTSQAAPHISGAVAVLREVYPEESNDFIVQLLSANGQAIMDPRNGIETPRLDLYNSIGIVPAAVPAFSEFVLAGAFLALIALGALKTR